MNVLACAERAQEVSTDLGLLQRDSGQWHRAALELVSHFLPVAFQGRTLQVEHGEWCSYAATLQCPRYVLREVREGWEGIPTCVVLDVLISALHAW